MEQMKIVMKIRNENNFEIKTSLLNGLMNIQNLDCGLPKNVFVDVRINKINDEFNDIKYRELMSFSLYEPMAVKIINTTNNRQLDFYYFDIMTGKQPLIPQLTIDGKPRCADGETIISNSKHDGDYWDGNIYNIADTQESFIIDGKEVVDILLFPNQIFNIHIGVMAKVNITPKNLLHFCKK